MRFRRTTNYRAEVPFDRPGTRRLPVYRGHGLVISAMLHLAVLVSLLLASFRSWHYESYAVREARALYVASELWDADEPPKPSSTEVSQYSEMTDSAARDRIEEQMAFANQRSDQQNLERLDGWSARLSQVSSESSIDRMAGALQRVLGTQPRVEQAKGLSSPAAFDVDTAQFHDIRRETTPAGSWRYVCILIDAQGYLFEVEMNAEDGRRLYETMQRIKQSPLLERVYRQIAMPLLDQMIHSARETAGRPSSPPTP